MATIKSMVFKILGEDLAGLVAPNANGSSNILHKINFSRGVLRTIT